jgi:hypothetical protein
MQSLSETPEARKGSLDGVGAADNDYPYRFGCKPRVETPYPFSTRQYLHLLLLRGRVQDGLVAADDHGTA